MIVKKFYILLFVLLGAISVSVAQQQPATRKIYLLHANTLSYNKAVDVERQVLRGDVQFRQDSVYMYCDSAYFYENTNSMEAFSNVRMVQGDTLSLRCDSMSYDGNTLIAQLFDNVKLKHNQTILTTDYMTYDRGLAEAHYPYSGVITDPDNHLRSVLGWYYPNVKEALFKEDVQLRSYDFSKEAVRPAYPDPNNPEHHPRAILYSDTLRYNFETADAFMLGPSRIEGDTATVISSRGVFNTKSQQSYLYDRSQILSPGRFATADSLFYDGLQGYGDGWGSIVMVDSIQKMKLTGEYMHYIDNPQSCMVTGKALAMEFSDKDTLYLHADTLRAFTIIKYDTLRTVEYDTIRISPVELPLDSIGPLPLDSIGSLPLPDEIADLTEIGEDVQDSAFVLPLSQKAVDSIRVEMIESFTPYIDTLRYMTAYYGVRYYRADLQGVCDSLHYSVRDSMATFVGNPVMWNTQYQITGDTIFAFMDETKSISRAEIHNQAFLVQEKDTFTMHELVGRKDIKHTLSRAYDQIKGKDLVCYFDSSKVKQMDMSGNVQIIYYPEESDGSMIGLNQMIGNYLSVWFKDQKMDHLRVWPNVVGSMTPIQLVTHDILELEGFRWMDYLRPKDPNDVFRKIEMSAEDKVEMKPLFDADELNGY